MFGHLQSLGYRPFQPQRQPHNRQEILSSRDRYPELRASDPASASFYASPSNGLGILGASPRASSSAWRYLGTAALIYIADSLLGELRDPHSSSVEAEAASLVWEDWMSVKTPLDYPRLFFIGPFYLISKGCQTIAPNTMFWGMTYDHPQVENEIRLKYEGHAKVAEELFWIRLTDLAGFTQMMQPTEDLQEFNKIFEESLGLLDIGLSKPPTRPEMLALFKISGPEVTAAAYSLDQQKMYEDLIYIILFDIQTAALQLSEMNRPEDRWIKNYFDEKGRLKNDQGVKQQLISELLKKNPLFQDEVSL